MKSLDGKVIVVTGSNGLLGRSIVSYLQSHGARVVGLDLSVSDSGISYACDVTDEDSVKGIVRRIHIELGAIDGWVNNAYPRTKDWGLKVSDIKMDSWRQNVDMQLNSYFMCSRIALEHMLEFRKGSVVNMSSIYGMVGPDFSIYEGTGMTMPAAYSAIKGGLINLTRYLASYYGPSGLRVNTVSPGGIFDNQPDSFVSHYEAKVPLRRLGRPQDISPAVGFLLSDEAKYITGHNLAVDGGWTAI